MSEIAAGAIAKPRRTSGAAQRVTEDSAAARLTLILIAVAFLALFLLAPLAIVFSEALRKGAEAFLEAFKEPDALAAIRLGGQVADRSGRT